LPLDLEAQAQIEAHLGLVLLERPHTAANARDQTLARKLGEVAPHRHLGNGESLRKFRNLNVISRLEQPQHVFHAPGLRKVAKTVHPIDAGEHTPERIESQYLRNDLRREADRKSI